MQKDIFLAINSSLCLVFQVYTSEFFIIEARLLHSVDIEDEDLEKGFTKLEMEFIDEIGNGERGKE